MIKGKTKGFITAPMTSFNSDDSVDLKIIPSYAEFLRSNEDVVYFELCCGFNEGKYDVLYGCDETLPCSLALGCRGAVGNTYNITAPLYAQLFEAFDLRDLNKARRLQRISMKVIKRLAGTGCFYSAFKEVMSMIGLNLCRVHPPRKNIDAAKIARLNNSLKELGFFDLYSKQPPV